MNDSPSAQLHLPRYSIGIGDRFARQGVAQLDALVRAGKEGVEVAPVWNKSHREHTIVGTAPADVRVEADGAVKTLDWKSPYFVDADHIGLANVEEFIPPSDFFTLDVADAIGSPPDSEDLTAFIAKCQKYVGRVEVPGIEEPLEITAETIEKCAGNFLEAVREAGRIYRRIEEVKGAGTFVTEVSMDETDQPQTPVDMFFILAAVADEGIPAQTIAPRFTGRFNKGVDYVGDVAQFTREFEEDLAVIALAVSEFGLPANLKLSVHSGSDKFSIYGPMREAIRKFDAGVHLKTAGTTWLEELIGLAEAGDDGLEVAKEVYKAALSHLDELAGPYASVIDIDPARLPSADAVDSWSGQQYATTLRHDQSCPAYNSSFRQLLHIGYKVAAELGDRYFDALEKHADIVAANVTENILARHIRPLFLG